MAALPIGPIITVASPAICFPLSRANCRALTNKQGFERHLIMHGEYLHFGETPSLERNSLERLSQTQSAPRRSCRRQRAAWGRRRAAAESSAGFRSGGERSQRCSRAAPRCAGVPAHQGDFDSQQTLDQRLKARSACSSSQRALRTTVRGLFSTATQSTQPGGAASAARPVSFKPSGLAGLVKK